MQNLILTLVPALPTLEAGSSLGGSPGPDLSRYFFVCALLIVLTLGVAWGLRKMVAGNLKFRSSQRSLRVVDVLAMGNRRKIAVVRCYDRTFVVGLGEKEISAIAELDPVIGSEAPAPQASRSDQGAFAQALEQVRRVMPSKPAVGVGVEALDSVAPALSRQLQQPQASQPVEEVPQQRQPRRRVLRKVPRRAALDTEARAREARAVATAALEIVAQKRQAHAVQQTSSRVSKTSAEQSPASAPHEPSAPPRLEGILG